MLVRFLCVRQFQAALKRISVFNPSCRDPASLPFAASGYGLVRSSATLVGSLEINQKTIRNYPAVALATPWNADPPDNHGEGGAYKRRRSTPPWRMRTARWRFCVRSFFR